MHRRTAAALGSLLLVLLCPASVPAQRALIAPQPGLGRLTVAAATPAELRSWDGTIDQFVQRGELVMRSMREDPVLAGHRHETFIQSYWGIPVYGGSLVRQTAGGVTVSVIGTLLTGITINPTPTLSAARVAAILGEVTGASLVATSAPHLTVFRLFDGTDRLTYRATLTDMRTYFVDADTGEVVWSTAAVVTQRAVGLGTGAVGDRKKISATRAAGTFRSHDQLRPAPIRTYDTGGRLDAFGRMLFGGLVFDSDFPTDADNTWTDPHVVDAHVHTGWAVDYVYKQHAWNGVDNRNSAITTLVDSSPFTEYNAFFAPPPFGPGEVGVFAYGRAADGVPITALDVVAHEFMHGVTSAALRHRTGGEYEDQFELGPPGPTTVTFEGRTLACATATLTGTDEADEPQEFPFLCDAEGRFVRGANHAGAVNEALSDIIGTGAEFFFHPRGTGPLRADYQSGEDILGFGPIRALDVPHAFTIRARPSPIPYPDHWARSFQYLVVITAGTPDAPRAFAFAPVVLIGRDAFLMRSADDGGVHINMTILGHAFYLAVEGGTNATSGLRVQGVGGAHRAQIEQAFFRGMTVLMPNAPSMPVAALTVYQAAVDLFGVTSAAAQAIAQAMVAVGLLEAA
jgi:Zn-dependent metalloprotease